MKYGLNDLSLLEIKTKYGKTVGGSQLWYDTRIQKMSGCGPVAACNIIYYLSRSRPEMQAFFGLKSFDKEQFKGLMEEMYKHMTPGMLGINTSRLFADGFLGYILSHGYSLDANVLDIPVKPLRKLKSERILEFIVNALQNDIPCAFLNLSNGKVHNLDGWHWVTIISLEKETMIAQVSDHGRIIDINLGEWLESAFLGGAFVYFS